MTKGGGFYLHLNQNVKNVRLWMRQIKAGLNQPVLLEINRSLY